MNNKERTIIYEILNDRVFTSIFKPGERTIVAIRMEGRIKIFDSDGNINRIDGKGQWFLYDDFVSDSVAVDCSPMRSNLEDRHNIEFSTNSYLPNSSFSVQTTNS